MGFGASPLIYPNSFLEILYKRLCVMILFNLIIHIFPIQFLVI